MKFCEFQSLIKQWAEERGIIDHTNDRAIIQLQKFLEEAVELSHSIVVSHFNQFDPKACDQSMTVYEEFSQVPDTVLLEFGDVFVTLVIMAQCLHVDLEQCFDLVWQKIASRQGQLINGQFVKQEDLTSA